MSRRSGIVFIRHVYLDFCGVVSKKKKKKKIKCDAFKYESFLYRSICSMDGTWTGIIALDQSGSESNGDGGALSIPKIRTGASLPDRV